MIKLLRLLKESFLAVKAYKLRTFFSVLGISFGIASLSIIVASVEGAFDRAYRIIDVFGPESIIIFGGKEENKGVRVRIKTLTMADLKAIKMNFPEIKLIMPVLYLDDITVRYRKNAVKTMGYGVSTDFEEAWSWYLTEGRLFSKEEVKRKENVCVLGKYVKNELFGKEDPLGKNILFNQIPCKVLGVLAERGTTPTGRNLDNRVLMPYTTIMSKINHDIFYINAIRIKFFKGTDVGSVVEELRKFLRERHHLKDDEDDDFFILSPKEIINFLVALTGSLVLFLGLSSTISLTVGGFVLMNLFLLSVNERKQEIGIRRALGGKRRDIMFQFMYEALIITTLGAVAGFLLGILGAKILTSFGNFPVHFSYRAFVVSLVVSTVVGILSVLNPALRASRLNPIEAIRS
ncbi:MAG: FtsX-like permease family protein [Aquificota bacterium]|nr:MAG: FtsX-like permease family protein [Aquificota bacterium]